MHDNFGIALKVSEDFEGIQKKKETKVFKRLERPRIDLAVEALDLFQIKCQISWKDSLLPTYYASHGGFALVKQTLKQVLSNILAIKIENTMHDLRYNCERAEKKGIEDRELLERYLNYSYKTGILMRKFGELNASCEFFLELCSKIDERRKNRVGHKSLLADFFVRCLTSYARSLLADGKINDASTELITAIKICTKESDTVFVKSKLNALTRSYNIVKADIHVQEGRFQQAVNLLNDTLNSVTLDLNTEFKSKNEAQRGRVGSMFLLSLDLEAELANMSILEEEVSIFSLRCSKVQILMKLGNIQSKYLKESRGACSYYLDAIEVLKSMKCEDYFEKAQAQLLLGQEKVNHYEYFEGFKLLKECKSTFQKVLGDCNPYEEACLTSMLECTNELSPEDQELNEAELLKHKKFYLGAS